MLRIISVDMAKQPHQHRNNNDEEEARTHENESYHRKRTTNSTHKKTNKASNSFATAVDRTCIQPRQHLSVPDNDLLIIGFKPCWLPINW